MDCTVATCIEKVKHNMIRMTGVHLRLLINMFFVGQISGLVETLTLGFTQSPLM